MDQIKAKYLNKIIKYGYKYQSNKCDKYLNKLLCYVNNYDKLILSGGNKKTLFFIATHDNRLQCLLSRLFSVTNEKYKELTKRLQNCAIIKITIVENALKVEMIYEGETTEDKKKFWTLNGTKDTRGFKIVHEEPRVLNDKRFSFLNGLKDNVVLFLVRHGKGIHNMNMTKRKIKGAIDLTVRSFIKNYDEKHALFDAELDETGIRQARKAGDILLNYLDENIKDWKTQRLLFGSSKLYRTRQTIGTIMSRLFSNINELNYNINVIPCSHEVAEVKNSGKCVDTGFKNELAYENKTACGKKSDNIDNIEKCKNIVIELENQEKLSIQVNWSEYYKYEEDCVDDTLISIAHKITDNPDIK